MLMNMMRKRPTYFKLSYNLICVFSKMPYYREMAQKLNINLPKLNEQIQIQNTQRCLVYGIKESPAQNFKDQDGNINQKAKQMYFDDQAIVGYSIDKDSSQIVQFNLVKRIAQNLELDICLMRQVAGNQVINSQISSQHNINMLQNEVILSLTKYREFIYREYYLKQLKNKSKRKFIQRELNNQKLLDDSELGPRSPGCYKNRIKSIRIGQEVHSNDLKNKQNQIVRWLEQGQRTVKVIANNNSDKSYKAIQNFCSLFEKQVKIIQQKIQPNPKKKPIFKLYALLQFQQEIQIDVDFINKRWRRRQAEIKMTQAGRNKGNSLFDIDFTNKDSQLQKVYLAAFEQSGIPYPKQYEFLTQIDKNFKKQGIMSFVRAAANQVDIKNKQGLINQFDDDEGLTQQQIQQRDKQTRRILGVRTVQDILQQMQQLKSRQYEMEQYQSVRYKQLQNQLKQVFENARISTIQAQN